MIKITEKEINDLHIYKVSWSDADLEKLIEDGIIIKIERAVGKSTLYRTFDGMVRWYEWPIPDEELKPFFKRKDGGYYGMIIRIKQTWNERNQSTRDKNLLRWKYRRLQNLAFEKKILDRNGRPCRECKSTNTTLSGDVNYHGGGYQSSSTHQCLDCGHFEVTGARF